MRVGLLCCYKYQISRLFFLHYYEEYFICMVAMRCVVMATVTNYTIYAYLTLLHVLQSLP